MAYEVKEYSNLIGMTGFSDILLKNHFTLYQGYVKNTNKVTDILVKALAEDTIGTPEYAELKRRYGFEFNGMRLHEYYFGNLGGDGRLDEKSKLYKKLTDDFGSYRPPVQPVDKRARSGTSFRVPPDTCYGRLRACFSNRLRA